jgi:hypothetical protein
MLNLVELHKNYNPERQSLTARDQALLFALVFAVMKPLENSGGGIEE